MANNCWNTVTISGKKKVIKLLTNIFNSYDEYTYFNDFNDFCNAFLKKSKEETENFEYDYYGTKWWDFYVVYEEGDSELNINGDSAWGPPLKFLQELSLKYNLEISGEYNEPGMNFAGKYVINNGNYETHDEYSSMEYEYLDDINSFFNNYVYCLDSDVLDNYENFDDFLESFGINFKESEIEELRNFYYENCNNVVLNMESKENILKELDEVNTHLKNLSMEGLSKKIENLQKKLKTAWEAEEKLKQLNN